MILFTYQVNPKGLTYSRLINLPKKLEAIEQAFKTPPLGFWVLQTGSGEDYILRSLVSTLELVVGSLGKGDNH